MKRIKIRNFALIEKILMYNLLICHLFVCQVMFSLLPPGFFITMIELVCPFCSFDYNVLKGQLLKLDVYTYIYIYTHI